MLHPDRLTYLAVPRVCVHATASVPAWMPTAALPHTPEKEKEMWSRDISETFSWKIERSRGNGPTVVWPLPHTKIYGDFVLAMEVIHSPMRKRDAWLYIAVVKQIK